MITIYKRTLVDTLKVVTVILMVAAGFLGGKILASNAMYAEIPAYTEYLNACLMKQHLVVFFLINGALLFVIVSSVSSGLIAGEVHEGTFRILVAKPNSRITILLAKVFGMFTGVMLLMILGLSTMYAAEIMLGSWDGNIVADLLKYFPGYILYGVIASFFLSSLAVLLSTIAKKRIFALLPMLVIIFLVLALPIIVRIVVGFSGRETPWNVNLVDLNYHFGMIFKWCCERCGDFTAKNNYMEIVGMLMNVFKSQSLDQDITRDYGNYIYTANETLPAMGVLLVYLVLGMINYLASILVINNKNV